MQLKLFSVVKDIVGANQLDIEFGENLTKDQFIEKFCKLYPNLEAIKKDLKLAADCVYLSDNEKISAGTKELALFTPVSGG